MYDIKFNKGFNNSEEMKRIVDILKGRAAFMTMCAPFELKDICRKLPDHVGVLFIKTLPCCSGNPVAMAPWRSNAVGAIEEVRKLAIAINANPLNRNWPSTYVIIEAACDALEEFAKNVV